MSHCHAFCANVHYARVGSRAPANLARLERAFLAVIDWRLACTREVLQLYYVNLVRALRRHFLHSSSSSLLRSSTAAPSTTTAAHATNTGSPTCISSTGDTAGSNPGTLPDEMGFDSPEDGASSGGVASDDGSATMGAISPTAAAAAGPLHSFGGPGMGAPARRWSRTWPLRDFSMLRARAGFLCFSPYLFFLFFSLRSFLSFLSRFRIRVYLFLSSCFVQNDRQTYRRKVVK